jgi:hypothetical protein
LDGFSQSDQAASLSTTASSAKPSRFTPPDHALAQKDLGGKARGLPTVGMKSAGV